MEAESRFRRGHPTRKDSRFSGYGLAQSEAGRQTKATGVERYSSDESKLRCGAQRNREARDRIGQHSGNCQEVTMRSTLLITAAMVVSTLLPSTPAGFAQPASLTVHEAV